MSNTNPKQELIPVHHSMVGTDLVPTVLATELHAFLGVKRDFSNWLKGRIEKYEFEENQDFISFRQNGRKPQGGRPSIEYHLTLDTAKELSMVENNAKGRKARRYFIQRDKELTAIEQPVPAHQPQLTYATKEQRKPLNDYVRYLANNSTLGDEMAWMFVNAGMGVRSSKQLTPEQIPEAIKVTQKLMQEYIHVGDYQAKDQPDTFREAEPVEPINAVISRKQWRELRDFIFKLMNRHLSIGQHNQTGVPENKNLFYIAFKTRFGLNHISDLPAVLFDDAIAWVRSQETELIKLHTQLSIYRRTLVEKFTAGLIEEMA